MKRHLLSLAVLALAGSSAAWAVDYDLSSLGSTSTGGRYITSLTVSDDAGNPSVTIGPARTGTGAIYWDLSAQSFTTTPGATVTINKTGAGSWMHTYFYIDFAGDGFNYDLNPDEYIDPTTHKLLSGVDLVWFNVFSPNDTNWYDCEGNTLSSSSANVDGSFTVKLPQDLAAGDYRARIKLAWSSLDPNGRYDVDSKNTIQANGGQIIDFTIKVEGAVEPEPPVVETYTAGDFYIINKADGKYLGTDSSNAATVDGEAESAISTITRTSDAGNFTFYIGTNPTSTGQHWLSCGSNGRFSVGNSATIYIYKVTDNNGTTITAQKATDFTTEDEYLLVGYKSPAYYACSNELYEAGNGNSQRLVGTQVDLDGTTLTVDANDNIIWTFSKELAPVVEPEPEPEAYYVFKSYNRGGFLTADNGALKHIDLTTASVWGAFPVEGEENGYYFKNYANGSYMVANATTSEEPVVVYMLPNGVNEFGISLSRTNPISSSSCIDANNYNTGCGNWQPSASDWQGTTWVESLIEPAEGQSMEEFLAFFQASDEIQSLMDALKTKAENLGKSLPGADAEFGQLVNMLDEYTTADIYTMMEGDLEAIREYFGEQSDYVDQMAMILFEDCVGERVTVYNVRRGETEGQTPYLAYVTVGEENTPAFNSVADADNEAAVWEIVEKGEGTYTLRNVLSNTYIQPIAQLAEAPVTDIENAGTFSVDFKNGYLQFLGDSYYYCFDTRGSKLAWWSYDHGCDWALALVEEEPVVVPELSRPAVTIPVGTASERYSVRFDDAILGDHTGCTGDVKGDADGRSRIFTYNVWVKPATEGNVMGLIVSDFRDNPSTVRAKIAGGKLLFEGRSQDTDKNGGYPVMTVSHYANDIELDEWTFLSIVADQENHKVSLYKDCVLAADYETDYGIGLLPDSQSLSFYVGENGFGGEFEQAQLWLKALTLDELKECYSMAKPEVAPEGLAAFYTAESGDVFKNYGTETDIVAYLEKGHETTLYGWLAAYQKDGAAEIFAVEDAGHVHPVVDVIFNQPVNPNFTMVLMQDGAEVAEPLLFSKVSVGHEGFPVEHFVVEANGTTEEVADETVFGLDAKTVTIGAVLPKYKVTVEHNATHVSVEVLAANGEAAEEYEHGTGATVKVTPLDGYEVKAINEGDTDILSSFEVDQTGTVPVYTLNIESLLGHKALTVVSDVVTGLDAISADAAAADCYDMLGRRVAAPSKGIYVVGGKKVVVK